MVEPIVRGAAAVAFGASVIAAQAAGSLARQGRLATREMFRLPARLLDVLVIRHVDLDRIVARIDVNAVARRLDLDALLAAADLPEIIRESTGTLASDTVRRARMRGIAADEAVDRVRKRLLRRDVRNVTGPA